MAAAKAWPVVLRHSGAVLAVMSGFDPSVPNMARVYGYWLGRKDHFPADRAEAERLLAIYPLLRDLARGNRAFITRAATWAAGQGIGQFIDPGCRPHPRSTRPRGPSCLRRGSPTSTPIRSCSLMPRRCWPPATG